MSIKEQVMAFADADTDGNMKLDFEEFYAMLAHNQSHAVSTEKAREWFDAADKDGSGSVSADEFFCWSLSASAAAYGANSIATIFKRYDKDKTGYLDLREFTKACGDVGMALVAEDIFRALDQDESGAISYIELSESLADTTERLKTETKHVLTSLVWASQGQAVNPLDTTGWRIKGDTAENTRKELRALLDASGHHVGELISIFDQDVGSTEKQIDDIEFYKAMRERLGFRGPIHVLQEVFKSLDTDGSGMIGFDELFEFVRGRRHSLDLRNKKVAGMRIEPPPGKTFNDIVWSIDTLRLLIQQMLERANQSTLALVKAWDKSGDGELSRKELREEIGAFFVGVEPVSMWREEVEPIVNQAFDEMDNSINRSGIASGLAAGKLDIVELQQWLNGGTQRKIRLKKDKNQRTFDASLLVADDKQATGRKKPSPRKVVLVNPAEGAAAAEATSDALVEAMAMRISLRQRQRQRRQPPSTNYHWDIPSELPSLPPIPQGVRSPRHPPAHVTPRIDRDPYPPPEKPIWYHSYAGLRQSQVGFRVRLSDMRMGMHGHGA